ncbi:hypothetical protein HPP92_012519 [Vanilla planifolia]|uniref:Uncharacterized protein n=1 Tax=Vanilla planifolia TaxID=51239 RepID=A0A835V3E8_VANPL|nr:hypothetical protein HPP92_012519 [Vanilla planifolia]
MATRALPTRRRRPSGPKDLRLHPTVELTPTIATSYASASVSVTNGDGGSSAGGIENCRVVHSTPLCTRRKRSASATTSKKCSFRLAPPPPLSAVVCPPLRWLRCLPCPFRFPACNPLL